ncbi:MAG: GTPase HflX [Actinomycetota bacterium]
MPSLDDERSDPIESHRGAFGDFGGEERAFIDRSFREKIVLVGVSLRSGSSEATEAALDELTALVDTAGADAVARVVQRRDAPDPATFVGKGKATEIRAESDHHDADTVVFDDELSPAQQANLDKLLGRTAIDRTAVILDIFAQNAHSQEGKAQVELALLRYRLPRLKGSKRFSQQGGGIGTRGPGETQLEVDRRRIERRIHKLEAQLRTVKRHRSTQSKQRRRTANRGVAIVGYTNAGKSTLLNRLTDAGVLTEDRLFATLDASTRKLQLPGGEKVFLTDTVGFVRKLPHMLVEAFRSTLDVVIDADLLVHVVDASARDPQIQIDAVREVLTEIGADGVSEMIVFNKIDIAEAPADLLRRYEGSMAVSAVSGEGTEELLHAIGDRLARRNRTVDLLIPFERGDIIAELHRSGQVLSEEASETGMAYQARLDEFSVGRLQEFVVEPAAASATQRDGDDGW